MTSPVAERRLAWVTTAAARGLDPDETVALPELARRGLTVEVVDWTDGTVDWDSHTLVVVRSAWDYPERLDDFLGWLDRVDAVTRIRNTPAMMRWSVDKHYLSNLQTVGVAVTPSTFVEPGERAVFPEDPFIVKPAVGAGSRDVARYDGPDQYTEAADHVARLHAGSTSALVQPLLASVAEEGEWALVYFDGRFSHAANKRVDLSDTDGASGLFAEERLTPHYASCEQLTVADGAIAYVADRFGAPLYARVDLVRDDVGQFVVLEVELVEPSLFLFEGGPAAIAAFADAVARI